MTTFEILLSQSQINTIVAALRLLPPVPDQSLQEMTDEEFSVPCNPQTLIEMFSSGLVEDALNSFVM